MKEAQVPHYAYEDISRMRFGYNTSLPNEIHEPKEAVKVGALVRIADALESIAKTMHAQSDEGKREAEEKTKHIQRRREIDRIDAKLAPMRKIDRRTLAWWMVESGETNVNRESVLKAAKSWRAVSRNATAKRIDTKIIPLIEENIPE